MSRQKKCYSNRRSRHSGNVGSAVDSSFGAPGNLHTSKKNYLSKDVEREPMGAYLLPPKR